MSGEIDTQFRRQKRPTVKPGGTLRTQLGMLAIDDVSRIDLADVTDDDARRSGAGDRQQVIAELTAKPEGDYYRIRLPLRRRRSAAGAACRRRADRRRRRRAHGPPRPARPMPRPMGRGRARRCDLIDDQPHVRAPDLAASVGRETAAFKNDVRKLKALGLTISHSPGYELSPRGPRPAATARRTASLKHTTTAGRETADGEAVRRVDVRRGSAVPGGVQRRLRRRTGDDDPGALARPSTIDDDPDDDDHDASSDPAVTTPPPAASDAGGIRAGRDFRRGVFASRPRHRPPLFRADHRWRARVHVDGRWC